MRNRTSQSQHPSDYAIANRSYADFKAYDWDGAKLTEKFSIDFTKEKLGRAHQMRFGAYSLYGKAP